MENHYAVNEEENYEFEEEEETSPLDEIADISQAFIVSSDWTLETIYSQINKEIIDLNPKFQRRDVWSDVKKSRLIESILLRIPIPQLLLAEKKEKYNSYIVIDGKQRLLAIKQFMDGLTNQPNALKLKGLQILEHLNGKNAAQIKEMTDEYSQDYSNFENETLRSIFIRNWPTYEYLYAVFNRLNTGSSPLSAQELRLSLFPGGFSDYANHVSVDPIILSILGKKLPDKRMKDVELVIRYYSFKYFAKNYNGKLKSFFDITVDKLNKRWETESEDIKNEFKNLIETINFTKSILGEMSFKRTNDGKVILVIFDVISFYLSNPETRKYINSIDQVQEKFLSKYNEILKRTDFIETLDSHTSDIIPTKKRFQIMGDMLNSLFKENELTYRINDYGVIRDE